MRPNTLTARPRAMLAFVGLLVIALVGPTGPAALVAPPAAQAAHDQYKEFPGGQGNPDGVWDVKHHKSSPDKFRYLLVACANKYTTKYRVLQDRVDPCGKAGVQAYHVPSSCEDSKGNKGPRWVNTKGDEVVVYMKGRYCAS